MNVSGLLHLYLRYPKKGLPFSTKPNDYCRQMCYKNVSNSNISIPLFRTYALKPVNCKDPFLPNHFVVLHDHQPDTIVVELAHPTHSTPLITSCSYQRQSLGISSVDDRQPHTVSEPTSSKPLSPTPQPCTVGDLDHTAPANKNEPVLIDCTQASPRHATSASTKTTASDADCPEVSEVSVEPQDRATGAGTETEVSGSAGAY